MAPVVTGTVEAFTTAVLFCANDVLNGNAAAIAKPSEPASNALRKQRMVVREVNEGSCYLWQKAGANTSHKGIVLLLHMNGEVFKPCFCQ